MIKKILLLTISLFIFSCDDGDDNNDNDNNVSTSDLQGNWSMYQVCELYEGECDDAEDNCDTEDQPEFDLVFTFEDNIVTGCTTTGDDFCQIYVTLELGSGSSVTICSADLAGCSDLNVDECNSHGDPCVVNEGGCWYWVDEGEDDEDGSDDILSETFVEECSQGTVELSNNILTVLLSFEYNGCTQSYIQYFEKIE